MEGKRDDVGQRRVVITHRMTKESRTTAAVATTLFESATPLRVVDISFRVSSVGAISLLFCSPGILNNLYFSFFSFILLSLSLI
ncbi:hypothetical protein CsatB_010230 [Cannabis sativa]